VRLNDVLKPLLSEEKLPWKKDISSKVFLIAPLLTISTPLNLRNKCTKSDSLNFYVARP